MNKKIIFTIVGIIIAVGLFYGGVKYGEAHSSNVGRNAQTAGAFGAGNFAGRGGVGTRAGANGGLVAGQVLSKDNQSITISLVDGGSRIIFYSASTSVMKTTSGTMDDLQMGTTVAITGSANPDGSLTAQSIQIRPAGSFGPRATSTSSSL